MLGTDISGDIDLALLRDQDGEVTQEGDCREEGGEVGECMGDGGCLGVGWGEEERERTEEEGGGEGGVGG